MRVLLDTHVLLWWLDDPSLLSVEAQAAIRDGRNEVLVSAVTVWEIVIKKGLGKLEAPDDLESELVSSRFAALPITVPHALAVRALPEIHGDPFDRMLVAQALIDRLTIVTRDPAIHRYPVPCIAA